MTGAVAYHAGLAAEDLVARDYFRRAHILTAKRWRGKSGEIDLIMRQGECVVFVEVKKSKTFATAATHLGRRQMDRICRSASEFVAGAIDGYAI